MFRPRSHIYDLISQAIGKNYLDEAAVVDQIIQSHKKALRHCSMSLVAREATLAPPQPIRGRGARPRPGMLEQAAEVLPGVTLVEGDMRSFRLARRFDAVACLFSSIGYMRSVQELDAAVGNTTANISSTHAGVNLPRQSGCAGPPAEGRQSRAVPGATGVAQVTGVDACRAAPTLPTRSAIQS